MLYIKNILQIVKKVSINLEECGYRVSSYAFTQIRQLFYTIYLLYAWHSACLINSSHKKVHHMTLKPACVIYVSWKYVYVPCVAEDASETRLTGERRGVPTESPPMLLGLLGLETTGLTDLGLVKVRLVNVELVRLATCWKTCQAETQANSALWFCDSSR